MILKNAHKKLLTLINLMKIIKNIEEIIMQFFENLNLGIEKISSEVFLNYVSSKYKTFFSFFNFFELPHISSLIFL